MSSPTLLPRRAAGPLWFALVACFSTGACALLGLAGQAQSAGGAAQSRQEAKQRDEELFEDRLSRARKLMESRAFADARDIVADALRMKPGEKRALELQQTIDKKEKEWNAGAAERERVFQEEQRQITAFYEELGKRIEREFRRKCGVGARMEDRGPIILERRVSSDRVFWSGTNWSSEKVEVGCDGNIITHAASGGRVTEQSQTEAEHRRNRDLNDCFTRTCSGLVHQAACLRACRRLYPEVD